MFKQQKLVLVFVLFLTGCSFLEPIHYDNNEYELIARLETSVKMINKNCSDREKVLPHIDALVHDAELLHTYTFYIPHNTETYQMADILKGDVREFEKQYVQQTDTPLYCKLKTQLFLIKVREALGAVARKRRI